MEEIFIRVKTQNQIKYFLRQLLSALVVLLILHKALGSYLDLGSGYIYIVYGLVGVVFALARTIRISNNIFVKGTSLSLVNLFSKKTVLNIDTEDYFVHAWGSKLGQFRGFNFQKILSNEKTIRVNCILAASPAEFASLAENFNKYRSKTLTDQLGLDKNKDYSLENTYKTRISNLYSLVSIFFLPILILLINMLFERAMDSDSLKLIILVLLGVSLGKVLIDNKKRNEKNITSLKTDKNKLEITTSKEEIILRWKDIREIVLTHPGVVSYGPRLVKITTRDKEYLYYFGDTRSPSSEYGLFFGLSYLFKRHKIGVFF